MPGCERNHFPVMDDLSLPVLYKGEEKNFPLRIIPAGYVYRIVVIVGDTELIFEHDEEMSLRGLMSYEDLLKHKQIDPELLEVIGEALQKVFS
jgi:hypothetical protein